MTLDQLDYILASDLSRFALEEESSPSTFYILTLGLGSKSLTDFTNCTDDVITDQTQDCTDLFKDSAHWRKALDEEVGEGKERSSKC